MLHLHVTSKRRAQLDTQVPTATWSELGLDSEEATYNSWINTINVLLSKISDLQLRSASGRVGHESRTSTKPAWKTAVRVLRTSGVFAATDAGYKDNAGGAP